VAVSSAPGPPEHKADDAPMRLRGADAVRLHATLAAGLTLCIGAFCFELVRALGGHTFSWLYVFEWPLFAGFAIYMWWNLLHGNDRRRAPVSAPAFEDVDLEGQDEGLVAWNRYLAEMEAAEAEQASEADEDRSNRAG
jgi:hypothetical protein